MQLKIKIKEYPRWNTPKSLDTLEVLIIAKSRLDHYEFYLLQHLQLSYLFHKPHK